MKRLFYFLLLMVFVVSGTISCTQKTPKDHPTSDHPSPPIEAKHTIKEYFPFISDRRMKYQGIGNEYAEKDVYVDFIKGNRIQLRVINPGTTLGQVYEIKDGELRLIKSQEEFYYRDNLLASQNPNPEILLKEPLEKGTEWTTNDGYKRYISEINRKIKTLSGEYDALEVITEGKDFKIYDYYVANIGHVKSVFESSGTTIETNLEKIEENFPVVQTVKFYYPDFLNDRIVFKREKLQFKTNETIIQKFEHFFKNPPKEDLTRIISSNTKINSLYLNPEENKVYIDLSKKFISDMNAGTSLEMMIIQSLVNTLGDYYNVDKVYISLDGKPYESGHFAIGKNDYFKVNYKNSIEIE